MVSANNDLTAAFPFLAPRPSADIPAYNCPADQVLGLLKALRDEYGYGLLADVTAIDHYQASPRYEVVYHLYNLEQHGYLRIVIPCAGDEEPTAPSVVSLWPGANWHERETYDMFGIRFVGHPDLRRILMWDSYPYFPLRKEFPLAGIDVPLPAEDVVERTGVSARPAPMMGGPFHAGQRGPMSAREPRADDETWTEAHRKPQAAEGADIPREFKKLPPA